MSNNTGYIKQLLSLMVILAIGVVGWVFFQNRQRQSAQVPALPLENSKAVMALSHVSHTATKDGALQWKLEANSAELESMSGKMVLLNPLVDFYLEDGSRVNLRANRGTLDTQNNDIEVNGNVRVANSRYTLKTEVLAYEHQKRRLHSNLPVEIIGRTFHLTSKSMIYDLDTNQATFNGEVAGTIDEKPAS